MSATTSPVAQLSPAEKRALLARHLQKQGGARGGLPLSFPQARLWFLDQFVPGDPSYNIPVAVRLPGWLDVAALERSLNEIIRRHESLRTTFALHDGKPVQVVAPSLVLQLPVVDLRSTPEETREAEANRRAFEESRHSFDLAKGPLLRVALIKLSDVDHLFVVVMHHIISDGWSMNVFHQELSALYSAYCTGRPSPLPELPVQYADFARWQVGWLQGDVLQKQLAYWRSQLRGLPPLLELPTDRPRPTFQSTRGAMHLFSLEASLSEGLLALSQREGVTLFMVVLAAFKTLLLRVTGERDFAVGSPIANRTRPELEGLIGFFVNTLVLRTDLAGDPTFRELLGRVREVTLGAYAHQDLPFEKLVEELQPERNLGHNPLFQVMFALQNLGAHERTARSSAPPREAPVISNGTAKFDLTLSLFETGHGAQGSLEYNTDLFDAETASHLVECYQYLLRDIVAHPDRRLSRLSLLGDVQRRELALGWSGPPETSPEAGDLRALIAGHAARTPDAVAVSSGAESVSYRELDRRANQLAHHLVALGVRPETPVGLFLERSVDRVVALVGVLKAGGVCVPLDPSEPPSRLGPVMDDAGAPLLLTEERLRARLPPSSARVVALESLREGCEDPPAVEVHADSLACLLYRPGPEGAPLGVQLSHAALCHAAVGAGFRLTGADRVAHVSGFSDDAACVELFGALAVGAGVVLFPGGAALPPRKAATLLRDQGVTVLFASASTLERLAREFPWALRAPRLLLCDDAPAALQRLAETLKPEVREKVLCVQAVTEAGGYPVGQPLDAILPGESRVFVGQPGEGMRLQLLDTNLEPVPPGAIGELYLGGEALARGYHHQPERTVAAFILDPHSRQPGARLYRTGDLARRLDDGSLVSCGRRDGRILLRGSRVDRAELEAALHRHPGVREAAVVVRDPPRVRERGLVAFTVAADGHVLTEGELRSFLKEWLPEALIPVSFTVLEALPRTPGGAVDHRALRDRAGASDATRGPAPAYVAPRNSTEERLARIWMQVFGSDRVGIHDNFFRLGGHSLLATQVVARVAESFQVSLPLRQLFELPTIAELGKAIDQLAPQEETAKGPRLVPVGRDQPLPLSFAQQRLWFLDQFEPDSAFYNIPLSVRLPGPLDVPALREALQALVRRHESLRTTFEVVQGQPVQRITPSLTLALPVVDLRELPEAAREAEAHRLAHEEARTPFQLQQGPLLRTRLLTLGDTEQLLLLTLHHIISDGWSVEVLLRELGVLYTAAQAGQPSPLPELPIQYADFAVWQRQWLSGPVLEEQLRYWKQQLEGAPAVLELPTDRPRPPVQVFRGGLHSFSLPGTLVAPLKALCEREQVTLFMTLLAAFKTLLHRYTGQEDLIVGTPIANRTRPELEGLIGFFANTLVLRTRLSGGSSFRQLLAQVREVTLGAYAHQDIPFEKLVEELKPERDLAYSPLFQVMFALQNLGRSLPEGGAPADAAAPVPGTGAAKFDLTAFLLEDTSGLQAGFEYNSDLFDAGTVARMAAHFENLLAAVVAEPDRPLSTLPVLSQAELLTLADWNATHASFPERCVHRLFEDQAARTPDAVALRFEGATLSYGELNARANRWAHRLQALGVRPDTRVGLFLDRSLEMVVAVLAVLKAGGAYVPLDPGYPRARLASMLEDARAPLLLTHARLGDRLPAGEARVLMLDGEEDLGAREDNPTSDTTPGHLAYVIYTSGSTGRPKGVAMAHRPLANMLHWQNGRSTLPAGARTLQFASLSFDVSFQEVFSTLTTGGTLVLVREELRRDPEALWALLRKEGVHRLFLPYVALQQLAEQARDLPVLPTTLREVITAGESLQVTPRIAGLFARLGCALYNQYGPTESHVVTELALTGPSSGWPARPSIGRPIPNVSIHLLDAHLQPVPVGVAGELYIGGVALARGYLDRQDLTEERFIVDPGGGPDGSRRLYRTGDRARYLPDGKIDFLGRTDDQLKLRGFRVEPGEIEAALRTHPDVSEAAVVAWKEDTGGWRLVAYVQPGPGASPTPHVLRTHLAGSLPEHMLPSGFMVLASLPRTPSGKLDRRALPRPSDLPAATAAAFVAPGTPTEEALARIWAELLRLERVGRHDHFFELGGHSLLATRVISRIREDLRVELPLRRIFESPTLEGLSLAVVQARVEQESEAEAALLLSELDSLSDDEARALLSEGEHRR
ncbi:amino acid adenylation domain-containing protein [Corallococcus sp. CA053C]|uniref:non-ribosomal peptide synthetase n=1 Tax=Corallococcus sp. CA053C TaxID=2316732 RepID=UPI000EA30755|nr:non-ribosomal peptide synthetase [Corallococcus sp. CA053C]RKH11041.1 amino acid adenylation domain-containing protein [Corallococcus sp. CA053C]